MKIFITKDLKNYFVGLKNTCKFQQETAEKLISQYSLFCLSLYELNDVIQHEPSLKYTIWNENAKKHFLLATKIILLYVLKILNFIKVLNDIVQ